MLNNSSPFATKEQPPLSAFDEMWTKFWVDRADEETVSHTEIEAEFAKIRPIPIESPQWGYAIARMKMVVLKGLSRVIKSDYNHGYYILKPGVAAADAFERDTKLNNRRIKKAAQRATSAPLHLITPQEARRREILLAGADQALGATKRALAKQKVLKLSNAAAPGGAIEDKQ